MAVARPFALPRLLTPRWQTRRLQWTFLKTVVSLMPIVPKLESEGCLARTSARCSLPFYDARHEQIAADAIVQPLPRFLMLLCIGAYAYVPRRAFRILSAIRRL